MSKLCSINKRQGRLHLSFLMCHHWQRAPWAQLEIPFNSLIRVWLQYPSGLHLDHLLLPRDAKTVLPDNSAAPCTCIAMSSTFRAAFGAATYSQHNQTITTITISISIFITVNFKNSPQLWFSLTSILVPAFSNLMILTVF